MLANQSVLKAVLLVMAWCGAMQSNTVLAHSVDLDEQEIQLFKEHYGNVTAVIDEDGIEHLPEQHDTGPGWPIPGNESYEITKDLMEDPDMTNARSSFPMLTQAVSFVNFVKTDGTGRRSYQDFQNQIDQLNDAFSASEGRGKYSRPTDSRIRFKLAGVRYVVNNDFFDYCALPTIIAKSRPRYMMDGARHLNVYVCWCQSNLGLSWLPYDSWFRQNTGEDHYALGAIIHWELLPGNNFRGGLWNKGNILTHEIGHYYGLRHPYQGDCTGSDANSDQIADTPRMTGNPLATCQAVAGRDSCKNLQGKDDMQNYMVATADSCRTHFTPGQVGYMQNVIRKYKPTFMKQLEPSCVAAVDDSDNSPDLQPCLDGTIRETNGKQWCKTDPDDDDVWAWACCPSSSGSWDKDSCRQGNPNFSPKGNKAPPNSRRNRRNRRSLREE